MPKNLRSYMKIAIATTLAFMFTSTLFAEPKSTIQKDLKNWPQMARRD